MNMKLTSLLSKINESTPESIRVNIAGVSFRVGGHENRLYFLPETIKDNNLIDEKGGDEVFIKNETFPFLETMTGIKWQWDKNNPSAGHIFEVDLNHVIQNIKGRQ